MTLAGDNGRRMISMAIRPIFAEDSTVTWLGLYAMDSKTDEERSTFLSSVKNTIRGF